MYIYVYIYVHIVTTNIVSKTLLYGVFAVSGEYDTSALFADISSMLLGEGILVYPFCFYFINYSFYTITFNIPV